MLSALLRDWEQLTSYERFEQIVSRLLLLLIAVLIVYSLLLAGWSLVNDIRSGPAFLGDSVLQDTFGSFLTVLILVEFNHSIAVAIRTRAGAVQVRVVVLIAILVLARKLILLDYKTASLETLLGLGGLALALGVLHWLLADGERRHRLAPPSRGEAGHEPD